MTLKITNTLRGGDEHMARKTRRELLEEQLDAAQIKAAYMLIDNELRAKDDPEYKTQDEIADACGVHRATLFRWRTQNRTFIEFRMEVARDYLGYMYGLVGISFRHLITWTN